MPPDGWKRSGEWDTGWGGHVSLSGSGPTFRRPATQSSLTATARVTDAQPLGDLAGTVVICNS